MSAFTFDRSVEVLERTPGVLEAMTAGLSDFWPHRDEGEDTWSPFDVQLEENRGRTLDELLREFRELRSRNLSRLADFRVGSRDLLRTGIHPDFGEVTLRQLLATWATHDLGHVAQIARVMARQYADEVGPWREYLRVLRD